MLFPLILISLIIPTLSTPIPQVCGTYGKYCGVNYGSAYGAQPVDDMDRACQFHDICVGSQGMLSCFCNEQLLMNLMIYTPTDDTNSQYRHCAIDGIDATTHLCNIDYTSLITRFYVDKSNNGYTYIPVYGYSDIPKMIHIKSITGLRVYYMWTRVFFDYFVNLAYQYPTTVPSPIDTNIVIEVNTIPISLMMQANTTLVFVYDGVYLNDLTVMFSEDSRDTNVEIEIRRRFYEAIISNSTVSTIHIEGTTSDKDKIVFVSLICMIGVLVLSLVLVIVYYKRKSKHTIVNQSDRSDQEMVIPTL